MKKIILSLILFVTILCTPITIYAEEAINSFDTKITAFQNGDMNFVETIKYDFGNDNRHGIFRYIPTYTKLKDAELYRISEIKFTDIKRDGKDEEYETDYSSDKVEVKIGDPDSTIRGEHTYEIHYSVKNGIASNFDTHDEIYWNITGSDWQIPVRKVTATIETPFSTEVLNVACFSGSEGESDANCSAKKLNNGVSFNTISTLNNGEGLTIVASYPVGTFPKSQLSNKPPAIDPDFIAFLKVYGIIWIILNIVVAPYIWIKYQQKKNGINHGKPAVNFDIPKDKQGKTLTPMEAGIIDNSRLEQNDVMATIFDLAIKKIIKIEEIKKEKTLGIFGGGSEYKLVKLDKDNSDLASFEKTLLDKLFSGDKKEVNMKDIKTFYATFTKLEKESFQSLIDKGFYVKNPKDQKAALLVFGIIGIATLNLILGGMLSYLSTKLNGRTKEGDRMDWQVEGLKIFLKNMKRHYNFQAEKAITVEKYIPYAMAFGFIEEFMSELKDMYPNYQPSFYSGHTNFYVMNSAFTSSMSTTFTTSAPSSSSGFSGGSSGGGGGGGGGGSW